MLSGIQSSGEALEQLEIQLVHTTVAESRKDLIQLEHLITTLTVAVLLFDEIENLVDEFRSSDSEATAAAAIALCDRLQWQHSTWVMMSKILTWWV